MLKDNISHWSALLTVFVPLLLTTSLLADDNRQKDQQTLPVKVGKVEGTCEIQPPSEGEKDPEWKPAKTGQVVPGGSKISTGFESKLFLDLADKGLIVVDALSQGKLAPLVKKGEQVEGELYMKSGNAKIHIKKKQVRSNFDVTTPQMTAAVRGTIFEINTTSQRGDEVRTREGSVYASGAMSSLQQEVNTGQLAKSSKKYKNRLYSTIDSMKTRRLSNLEIQGQLVEEQHPDNQEALERTGAVTASNLAATNGGTGSLTGSSSSTDPQFTGKVGQPASIQIPPSNYASLSKQINGYTKARLYANPTPEGVSGGEIRTVTILDYSGINTDNQLKNPEVTINGVDSVINNQNFDLTLNLKK